MEEPQTFLEALCRADAVSVDNINNVGNLKSHWIDRLTSPGFMHSQLDQEMQLGRFIVMIPDGWGKFNWIIYKVDGNFISNTLCSFNHNYNETILITASNICGESKKEMATKIYSPEIPGRGDWPESNNPNSLVKLMCYALKIIVDDWDSKCQTVAPGICTQVHAL